MKLSFFSHLFFVIKYSHLVFGGDTVKIRRFKKFVACSTVVALLGTGGYFKLCKDKSDKFVDKTINYSSTFVSD